MNKDRRYDCPWKYISVLRGWFSGLKSYSRWKIPATCPECRWRQKHASNSAGWCSGGSACRWSHDPSPGHRRCFRPCHEMDIFFEGLNILISTLTFCVCADGLQVLLQSFHYSIQLLTFYLISWKYLNLNMLAETLLRVPFSVIGRCSLVPTSLWKQGKCARINLSHGFWYDFNIFSVKIAALGSLERVAGRIFKISK
jgi:hypothetical protein